MVESLPPRYQSLDLWRGLACLAVIVHHSATYGQFVYHETVLTRPPVDSIWDALVRYSAFGAHGVTLFFVVSGYCITATVEATRARGRSMATYFWRRLRRILPPYWAMLTVTTCMLLVAKGAGVSWIWTHSHAIEGGTGVSVATGADATAMGSRTSH